MSPKKFQKILVVSICPTNSCKLNIIVFLNISLLYAYMQQTKQSKHYWDTVVPCPSQGLKDIKIYIFSPLEAYYLSYF
jgi:hypothetical protein